MINNRQNGRRRGRGGQRVGGGNPGRPESGNRIDNRARGNASQLHEKYKALAADAQRQGDRVNTEYYLQFADHYFRVLAESRPRQDEQQQSPRRGADAFDDEFDGDGEEYGQEGEPGQPDQYQPRADTRGEGRGEERPRQEGRQQEHRQQDGRYQEGRQQDDRQQDERPRYQPRPVQGQDDRPRRDDRPRQEAREDQPRREDRPRRDGARDQRPREERTDAARVAAASSPDPAPALIDDQLTPPRPVTQEASAPRAADMEAPAPRRRGRPPKARPEASAAEPTGLDADRLPPSLSLSASAEPDAGEPAEKPRRRRRLSAEAAEAN